MNITTAQMLLHLDDALSAWKGGAFYSSRSDDGDDCISVWEAIRARLTEFDALKAEVERLKKSYQMGDYAQLTDDYFAMRERAEKAEAALADYQRREKRLSDEEWAKGGAK